MNSSGLKGELRDLLEGDWPPIRPMPSAGTKIVIYGAGNSGRRIAKVMRKHEYPVAAFIDTGAASIGNVENIPCFSPENPKLEVLAAEGCPVVMAVFNNEADLYQIGLLLTSAGFARVISFYELNEHFPGALQSLYWLTRRSFYKSKTAAVLEGFDVFDDDLSRSIYLESMKLRLTYDSGLLREPERENSYFVPELFRHREPMRFIDGGAYTGDTLEFFLERGLRMESVAAFEPDVHNFKRLCDFVKLNADKMGSINIYPCGLDEAPGTRRFKASGLSSSAITDSGEELIPVVPLDEALPVFAPTFIKLDIEGAELAALRGARQMIGTGKPDLAVCVYHAPEHLWEIPLLMRSLLPGHKLALRYHQLCGFEMVAYAWRA